MCVRIIYFQIESFESSRFIGRVSRVRKFSFQLRKRYLNFYSAFLRGAGDIVTSSASFPYAGG